MSDTPMPQNRQLSIRSLRAKCFELAVVILVIRLLIDFLHPTRSSREVTLEWYQNSGTLMYVGAGGFILVGVVLSLIIFGREE